MLKIIITGTESTGKTTLAEQLGAYYGVAIVPDISRRYVAGLAQPYTRADVIRIAEEIVAAEEELEKTNPSLLISDNDLINIKIWLQFYHWNVPQWIEERIRGYLPNLFLVGYTDVPWEADGQRTNEHSRDYLYYQFITELQKLPVPYLVLKGDKQGRLKKAIEQIEGLRL